MTPTSRWVDWAESDEGVSCLNIETLKARVNQKDYLTNRLWRAFMAGRDAGLREANQCAVIAFKRMLGIPVD